MHKLIVVGSGIKSVAHLTEETIKIIQLADKVLYLVNEDNLKAWIEREAYIAESLDPLYFENTERLRSYVSITDYIISEYKKVKILCVVFYGHPTVFVQSGLEAVKQIQKENGSAIILPAISSVDCLFSDLQIDPGNHGCFFIDATELLVTERQIDVYSNIILFQIFNLGRSDTKLTTNLKTLFDYLLNYYPEDQPICIYQASLLPAQKSKINWITLGQLEMITVFPISTLYIPPLKEKMISKKYATLLK